MLLPGVIGHIWPLVNVILSNHPRQMLMTDLNWTLAIINGLGLIISLIWGQMWRSYPLEMKLSELSESLFPLQRFWSLCGFLFTAGSNNLNGEDSNVPHTGLNNITEISDTEHPRLMLALLAMTIRILFWQHIIDNSTVIITIQQYHKYIYKQ